MSRRVWAMQRNRRSSCRSVSALGQVPCWSVVRLPGTSMDSVGEPYLVPASFSYGGKQIKILATVLNTKSHHCQISAVQSDIKRTLEERETKMREMTVMHWTLIIIIIILENAFV